MSDMLFSWTLADNLPPSLIDVLVTVEGDDYLYVGQAYYSDVELYGLLVNSRWKLAVKEFHELSLRRGATVVAWSYMPEPFRRKRFRRNR